MDQTVTLLQIYNATTLPFAGGTSSSSGFIWFRLRRRVVIKVVLLAFAQQALRQQQHTACSRFAAHVAGANKGREIIASAAVQERRWG